MSFDPALDRRTRAHGSADLSITLSRGAWTAALVGENLTNNHSDVFGFGNPYRVRSAPQRTPTIPRTIGLKLTHSLKNLFQGLAEVRLGLRRPSVRSTGKAQS
jgi:hypothetical protein